MLRSPEDLLLNVVNAEELRRREKEKKDINPKIIYPKEYYDITPIFNRADSEKLPLHRSLDYYIKLKEGATAPLGPLCNISRDE